MKIFNVSLVLLSVLVMLQSGLSSCKKDTVTIRDTVTVTHTDTLIQVDTFVRKPSKLDLFTGKEWVYDEYYLNATDSLNGDLKYKRGASDNEIDLSGYRSVFWKDGTLDDFRNGIYHSGTWNFTNADSTQYIAHVFDGDNTTTILYLDSTHFNWIDYAHNARAKQHAK